MKRAGAAGICVAVAVATPLLRRRARIPAPVTLLACALGPAGLSRLPRSRARDVAVFTAQMWAFTMAHELPYDDPVALRRRLAVRYPIAVDRALGAGTLPTVRLQRALAGTRFAPHVDRALSWAHWLWFLEPYLALAWVLARDRERFGIAARQLATTFDLGCVLYFAVPTAPPWWASEQGMSGGEVRRIMAALGEETWGPAWPALYRAAGEGNPWAAMPSLHFATALVAAMLLAETGGVEGALGWAYALTLGFALLYLGEHYLTDLAAGALLAALVRRASRWGEPRLAPLLCRLETGRG
ncbi:MAG TPA: phosphatase PAP2 family protein [Solirubrobacterales bacterium]|nr:phosphatase PAP2 family protein [Solirubrobacterales bacterium]